MSDTNETPTDATSTPPTPSAGAARLALGATKLNPVVLGAVALVALVLAGGVGAAIASSGGDKPVPTIPTVTTLPAIVPASVTPLTVPPSVPASVTTPPSSPAATTTSPSSPGTDAAPTTDPSGAPSNGGDVVLPTKPPLRPAPITRPPNSPRPTSALPEPTGDVPPAPSPSPSPSPSGEDPTPEDSGAEDSGAEPAPEPGPAPDTAAQPARPTSGQAASGTSVDLGSGVSVVLAPGYSVSNRTSNQVIVGNQNSFITITAVPNITSSADTIASQVLSDGPNLYRNFQASRPKLQNPPSANILSFATAEFQGLMASNQQSIPIEGVVYTMVRQDRTGIAFIATFREGAWDDVKKPIAQMLFSVIGG